MSTYLNGLQSAELDPESIEFCIRDSVNARIDCPDSISEDQFPASIRSADWVELHFDDYDISAEHRQRLYHALSHHGVGIPGTAYRLRYCVPVRIVVEPREGTEPELPADWMRYVVILGPGSKHSDWSDYHEQSERRMP
jgi:hypothetical protein